MQRTEGLPARHSVNTTMSGEAKMSRHRSPPPLWTLRQTMFKFGSNEV